MTPSASKCLRCYADEVDARYAKAWAEADNYVSNCNRCSKPTHTRDLSHHKGMWWCEPCWQTYLTKHADLPSRRE